jgi:hypothetical protein
MADLGRQLKPALEAKGLEHRVRHRPVGRARRVTCGPAPDRLDEALEPETNTPLRQGDWFPGGVRRAGYLSDHTTLRRSDHALTSLKIQLSCNRCHPPNFLCNRFVG